MNAQEIEDRITLEALNLYFQGTHRNVLKALVYPLVVIAVMWLQIDHGLLLGWGMLMSAGIVAKYFLSASYLANEVAYSEASKWGWRATYVAFYLGMLWSVSMFMFYVDDSVPHKIFMITILVSLGSSSYVAAIYWKPLHFVYSVPIIAALIIRLAMEQGYVYVTLAVLLLTGVLGMSPVVRRLHATVRSEMRLRHESGELTKALQVKTAEAEEAVMAKSRVLAAASHDLRQPLHALTLFIDVLKESKSSEEREKIYPRIDLSLGALRKLFDTLLDMSRLDAKVVQPEFTHFDVVDLLDNLYAEFNPTVEAKGLEFRMHARSCVIVSDRVLLERILRNLISNAIRYTDTGGILLSTRLRKEGVLLQVWDTGIGIAADNQEEVFVEFHQLHNPHRGHSEGLGLGLAIVRRLCQLLQCRLELRSQTGKGSVFSLGVPRGSPGLIASKEKTSPDRSWDLKGRRVLVIDDENNILSAMDILLSKWGIEVITAASLTEGQEKLNAMGLRPDLIMSDLRLHDNNSGIDAIDALRNSLGKKIPGVLITGDTEPEQIRRAMDSGYKLVQKPVKPIQLRSIIQHYLSDAAK